MDQVRAGGGTQAMDTKQLFQTLVKDTLEAFLELEMEEHLGYSKHDPEGRGSGNSRNGATSKTVRGDFGQVEIESPRDRNSSFEPKIVAKRQTSVGNFSEAVISLYTRGLTTRETSNMSKTSTEWRSHRNLCPARPPSSRLWNGRTDP
jgi:putative transposase